MKPVIKKKPKYKIAKHRTTGHPASAMSLRSLVKAMDDHQSWNDSTELFKHVVRNA